MIISSKGRYALRVMLELAQYGGDGAYIRLGDIAQRQGISRKYLESIMTALAKAGLVESALGKAGGYRLVRPAEDYPIGEILQAAEGELMPVSCLAMDGKPCEVGLLHHTPVLAGAGGAHQRLRQQLHAPRSARTARAGK